MCSYSRAGVLIKRKAMRTCAVIRDKTPFKTDAGTMLEYPLPEHSAIIFLFVNHRRALHFKCLRAITILEILRLA